MAAWYKIYVNYWKPPPLKAALRYNYDRCLTKTDRKNNLIHKHNDTHIVTLDHDVDHLVVRIVNSLTMVSAQILKRHIRTHLTIGFASVQLLTSLSITWKCYKHNERTNETKYVCRHSRNVFFFFSHFDICFWFSLNQMACSHLWIFSRFWEK